MKRKLPRHAPAIGVAVGVVLFALVGWLALVSPQRSKASSLKQQIEQTEAQIRSQELRPKGADRALKVVRIADVFRLSKAIPDRVDMADIVLELNRVAGESGITFASITPHSPTLAVGYESVPIDVVFSGNYFELLDFLYRLRNLVEVHDGLLQSTGRLFTVDHLAFGQGSKQFPNVQATLTINAFVYDAAAVAAAAAAAAATSTSSGSTTTSTTSTSPAPASAPPSGATAAGVRP